MPADRTIEMEELLEHILEATHEAHDPMNPGRGLRIDAWFERATQELKRPPNDILRTLAHHGFHDIESFCRSEQVPFASPPA